VSKSRSKRSRPRDRSADIVRYGPLEFRRSGKFLSMRNTAPPEQHDEIRARYTALCANALHEFRAEMPAVEAILAKYDPASVIGRLILRECAADPETYEEPSYKGSAVKLEHIVLLYAKRAYPEGFQVQVDDADMQRLVAYVDQMPFMLPFMYDPSILDRTASIDEVRSRIISWHTGVRMPAYEHQYIALLEDLFAPFESQLVQGVGFSCHDAIWIEQAITQHTNGVLTAIVNDGVAHTAALLEAVRGEGDHGSAVDQVAARLRDFSPADAQAIAFSMTEQWCALNIGHALPLDVERLSALTALDAKRVAAAVEFFALHFGDVPATYVVPEPQSLLHAKPLLAHNKKYFAPSITLFLPAIQSSLEHAINPARRAGAVQSTWDSYVEHRRKYTEGKSLEYLSRVLVGCIAHQGLTYRLDGRTYELDGLVLFDRTLIFVEVKAGSFSPQAKRGDLDAVVGDVEKLINEAHVQASRAREYYANAADPVFTLGGGARLTIDKTNIDRCLLVTVTLEQLGALTGDFNTLPGRRSDYVFPWAVSLWDLEVVSELLSNGAELIHYLERRSQLSQQVDREVTAHDELDWLGCYLHESLEFAEAKHGTDHRTKVQLAARSVAIDSYYFYKEGQRLTPAPKPVHALQPEIRHIIDSMQIAGSAGWSELAIVLLGLPHKLRRSFGRQLRKATARNTDRLFSVRTKDGSQEVICGVGSCPTGVSKKDAPVCMLLEVDDKMVPRRGSLCRDGGVVLDVNFSEKINSTMANTTLAECAS